MTLILARVDQKLVHGQISVAWVPHLRIDTIIVADEDAAMDLWTQKIMKLGAPPDVTDLLFVKPSDLSRLLEEEKLSGRRIILLFKSIGGVMAALSSGMELKVLNLGNQAYSSCQTVTRLADTFYANDEDLKHLAELEKRGLKLTLQAVPAARAVKCAIFKNY